MWLYIYPFPYIYIVRFQNITSPRNTYVSNVCDWNITNVFEILFVCFAPCIDFVFSVNKRAKICRQQKINLEHLNIKV